MVIHTKLDDFQPNKLLATAKIYLSLGYSVIPTRQKVATVPWTLYQTQRPSLDQLTQWFTDDGYTSLAIITGRISRLAVLDFDAPKGFQEFCDQYPHLAETHTVQTRRGYHLYYHIAPQCRLANRCIPGIDLQYEGRYVVAPPSKGYTTIIDGTPRKLNQQDVAAINRFLDVQQGRSVEIVRPPLSHFNLPPELVDQIAHEQHQKAQDRCAEPHRGTPQLMPNDLAALYRYAAPQKGRNVALFQLALLGRDNGLTQDQVAYALTDVHAKQKTTDDHKKETYQNRRREAINTIRSAVSRKPRKALHQYREPAQLPNTVREALFQRKLTCLVRVIEALRLLGVQPGQRFTKKEAVTQLKGIVGQGSVYNALNTLLPRTPSSPAYGIATTTGKSHNCKCLQLNPPKPLKSRPPELFMMPTNLKLADKLSVRNSTISDELTLDDLKSAKSTREACHAALIQRKPGQYTVKFFASRAGMSERTINRYNAADENIHGESVFHAIPVFWHNLEAVIPEDPVYFPHGGVFLEDTRGRKYPPKREIARRLLSQKQFVTLKQRMPNYWWYGDAPMPFRFLADYHAIQGQLEQKATRTFKRKYEYPVITSVVAEAPTKTPQQPSRQQHPTQKHTSYRQPLQYDEDFARYTYRKINEMGGEGQISLESARRLVYKYGEKAVRRAMDVATSRRSIRKPVGFISTFLRSDALGG